MSFPVLYNLLPFGNCTTLKSVPQKYCTFITTINQLLLAFTTNVLLVIHPKNYYIIIKRNFLCFFFEQITLKSLQQNKREKKRNTLENYVYKKHNFVNNS